MENTNKADNFSNSQIADFYAALDPAKKKTQKDLIKWATEKGLSPPSTRGLSEFINYKNKAKNTYEQKSKNSPDQLNGKRPRFQVRKIIQEFLKLKYKLVLSLTCTQKKTRF